LASNPAILTQFKTFIETTRALTVQTNGAIQLLITQLDLQIILASEFIAPFTSAISLTKGQLGAFGFDQFKSCPPAQAIRDFSTKITKTLKDKVADQTGEAAGKTGKIVGGIKKAVEIVRMIEFEIFEKNRQIQSLKAKVNQIAAINKLFDAIIDAIDAQFSVTP